METFTLGLGNWWWLRAFGGNPLVRRSDRIEAMVLIFAVLATVVAIPLAGTFGTLVHEERTRMYADEARTSHQVVATATADGQLPIPDKFNVFTAEATWSNAGKVHRGVVTWADPVKAGDQQSMWLNDQGQQVRPPSPASRADFEAVTAGLSVWLAVAQASAGAVYLVRRWLDRSRYAEWDHDINTSRDNNGGRNHQL